MAVALILIASVLAPASPAAAAAQLRFDIGVRQRCVFGSAPGADQVTVALLGPDGKRRDRKRTTPTSGQWSVCFAVVVRSGDRVRAVQGSLDRAVRVPSMSITVNRVTDVLAGTAPKGKDLVLRIGPCITPDRATCSELVDSPARSDAKGRYRRDMTSVRDIRGADQVQVVYENTAGDTFTARTFAPSFAVTAAGRASLSCAPSGTHRVTARRSDGTLKGSATFPGPQACSAATPASKRLKRAGKNIGVVLGNVLRSDIATDARFTWPDMSVSRDGDGAAGRCFRNGRFLVEVFRSDGGALVRVGRRSGTAAGDGGFTATAIPDFSVQTGDRLRVTCQTLRGDRAVSALTSPVDPA